jgi:hypothetical protein
MTEKDIKINSIALNNIKLDEMIMVDNADGSEDPNIKRETNSSAEKATGLNSPFVVINGYSVSRYMRNFSLDLCGFIPVIKFTFAAADTIFMSVNYPKDGDIVSVYIRSADNYYKPFRMDFLILSVLGDVSSAYSERGTDPEGEYFRFSIVAECYIPGLYKQRIKAFPNIPSIDALLEVSQELNLGFSTNDKSTNDIMSWICPNYSYYDFIQEVSIRAYKDDETSFYDCWIDSYYNLNFVNLGSQFSFEGISKETAYFTPGYTPDGIKVDAAVPGTPAPKTEAVPLVLTNFAGSNITPFFINGYTLTSRAGNNSNSMGYVTNIGFYDDIDQKVDPKEKYVKYNIESLTTDVVSTGIMLQKGRVRSSDYKEETRSEWLGVLNRFSDGSGVHQNYLHSKFQNLININDVTKITLEVEISTYYPGIIRGQVIPVSIYVTKSGNRQQNVGQVPNNKPNNTSTPTLDSFLSGNYVVMGMEVTWSSTGKMREKLILSKRTWQANSSGPVQRSFPNNIVNK